MLEIVKKRISITQGDNASIKLVPKYKDKTEYVAVEGDKVYFRIKAKDSVKEIECSVNADTNRIVVTFEPEDTRDIAPGIYRYEAELVTTWNMHYTFIADQTFIVGKEIEVQAINGNGRPTNGGNNLPSIDGEIGDEPVVDGDLQPTNPSLDYNDLNHLPKLNGHTFIGEMTNEDLEIPTKLSEMLNDDNYVQDADYQHTDNNYDDTDKGIVDGVTDALADKVDKIDGKGLSTNDYTDTDKAKLDGIQSGAEVNVQPDWNEADTSQDDYIKNKPTLGTASSRNATSSVTSGSTDLVESGAVKTAIDNAVASSYHHAGVKTVAELVPALLIAENQGNVYNITDDGVTTADFIEGAGLPIKAGDNVGVAQVGSGFKFDLLSGFIDTSNFVEKSATRGLIRNDGSIDESDYALESEIPDISGKADKVLDAIAGDFAILLANGNVGNSSKKPSDFALKSEMSVTDGSGADADKVTIQLKSGTSATVLKTHQDISGKVDKDGNKVLSTNDYTDEDKDKLDGISEGATKTGVSSVNGHLEIDDEDVTVYDDTEIKNALSTDLTEVEGNPLNFTTLSAQTAESTIVDLEPIQDLHGYDKPWVGGAGKNKLPLTVDGIKSANTSGTWSGNVYTINSGTIEILVDSDNNVIGIKINGSFNATSVFLLYVKNGNPYPFENTNYSLNGCPVGGSASTFKLDCIYRVSGVDYTLLTDLGVGATTDFSVLSNATQIQCRIVVYSGTYTNKIYYPMLRLSTETDATFQPYTNIASISGRTEIGILGCGKNLLPKGTSISESEITFEVNDNGSVTVTTKSGGTSGTKFWAVQFTIKAGTYIFNGCPTGGGNSTYLIDIRNAPGGSGIPGTGGDIGSGSTFTITESLTAYLNIRIASGYEINKKTFYPMIRLASDADSNFEPYTKSNDLTISFGQTVYGGTLDVEKGILTVDRKKDTIDGTKSITWYLQPSSALLNIYANITSVFTDIKTIGGFETKSLFNEFKAISNLSARAIGTAYLDNGWLNLQVELGSFESSNDVNTWLINNNLEVVYELATPITIQLTPNEISLLEGVNNISTDGDKITLTYRSGEVATLGDLTKVVEDTDSKIANAQILTDTETGYKYKLVVSNGVLSVEQVSN